MQKEAPSCGLGGTGIAAIGKVEPDHGRYRGTLMAMNGDLFPPLWASHSTARALIRDSDGGVLDGDLVTTGRWDRCSSYRHVEEWPGTAMATVW